MTSRLDEISMQLEDIIQLLTRMATERSSAVSSVEIEDLVGKQPKTTTKHYAGSVPPIEEALNDHARLKQLADEMWRQDWQATVDQLRFQRAAD